MKNLENPEPTITPAHLVDIYIKRLQGQAEFYRRCWDLFGFPVTRVFVSKTSFMLMECLRMAQGKMAAGDWLDLNLEILEDQFLDPDLVVLAHPFFPQIAFLESGPPMKKW